MKGEKGDKKHLVEKRKENRNEATISRSTNEEE